MSTEARIPMTVIAGFFGAGKTTYINTLIHRGLDPNTVILVNDFGDINIDASLIRHRDEQIIQLQNGCICCTLGGTLAETMTRIVRFEPRPAAIVIEASGIGRPTPIANVARVSAGLSLAQVICLVDCQSVENRLAEQASAELARAQIAEADTLLLNKRHGLSVEDRERIVGVLDSLNPTATLCDAPPAMEQAARGSPRRAAVTEPRRAGHGGLTTFSLRCRCLGSEDDLVDLLGSYADVLVRAKGHVVFAHGDGGPHLLQYVNGATSLTPTMAATSTQLVLIGYQGRRLDALRSGLDALVSR